MISIVRAARGSRSRLTRKAKSPPRSPKRIGTSHHNGFTALGLGCGEPNAPVPDGDGGGAGSLRAVPGPMPTSALYGSHALNCVHACFHPSSVRGKLATGVSPAVRSQMPKKFSAYPSRYRLPECVY
jgi:hypothetical protein